jgi:dsDNA-binding SOS-regulon protein
VRSNNDNILENIVSIKQRSLRNDNIEMIDLSNQNMYGKTYLYLKSLDKRVIDLMSNIWFCVEIIDENNVYYSKKPLNNMVLTSINIDDRYINDINIINEYSELLGVTSIPTIYSGKLQEKQIEMINYFLNTNKDDLSLIFGETENFTSFFYKILSTNKSSFLNDDYHDINKLIIRTKDDDISFELLNPLADNSNEYMDFTLTYSIIVAEMLEFMYKTDYENIYITGEDYDNIYLNLMSELFVNMIENKNNRILKFEFDVPPYIYLDSYKINRDCLSSRMIDIINSDPRVEFIFKTCFKIFKNPVKKPFGVITEPLLVLLNKEIMVLSQSIDRKLRIETIDILKKSGTLGFNDFVKIQDTTADGKAFVGGKNIPDTLNTKDKK